MLKKVFNLTISFIIFLCLMWAGHNLIRPTGIDKVTVLDDGWTIIYNGTVFDNAKLSDLRELIGSGTYILQQLRDLWEMMIIIPEVQAAARRKRNFGRLDEM